VKTKAASRNEASRMRELILYVFCGASFALTVMVAVIAVCHFQKYNRRFRTAGLSADFIQQQQQQQQQLRQEQIIIII